MKTLSNKIKSEKKKENKNIARNKQLEIELIETKYVNSPNKLQSELKKLNKNHVIEKSLHKIKQERIRENGGEFEVVRFLKLGDQIF